MKLGETCPNFVGPAHRTHRISRRGFFHDPSEFRSQLLVGFFYFSPSGSAAERMSILDAAAAFGVSRPTFYQAQVSFEQSGLAGLLPARRGPKGGHKLTGEVLDYVVSLRESEPKLTTVQCVKAIQKRFAITIHRRSLERALARRKKKPRRRT
jgi:transposase